MKAVLAVLGARAEGKGFAVEVLEGVKGKTFNSVNATLAALAAKELVTKEKKAYGEGASAKMLTEYTITEAGRKVIEANDEVASDNETIAEQPSLFKGSRINLEPLNRELLTLPRHKKKLAIKNMLEREFGDLDMCTPRRLGSGSKRKTDPGVAPWPTQREWGHYTQGFEIGTDAVGPQPDR